MANPQITTTPVSTAFSTTNTSTATASATNWSTQSFTGPSVSSTNAESSGMNTTNIVQSNLTRKQPYSIASTQFDGLNHFGGSPFSGFELQTISYSVWFKRTGALTSSVVAITQGSSSNKGWTLWLTNNAIIAQFGAGNNNSYNNSVVSGYKTYIPDNTWGNVIATCDGTDQKIYVNGILRNTYTNAATIDYSSVVGFRIGERANGAMNFYGEISNPAVWDKVLTADDAINLYNNGVTQDLNNFRITPLAWWELGSKYTYWNGSDLVARSTSSGDFDVTGTNTTQSQIVGNSPGSENAGKGFAMASGFFLGKSKNSVNNSYSINMADYADGVTNPANSGRSTDTPS